MPASSVFETKNPKAPYIRAMWGSLLVSSVIISAVIVWLATAWFLLFTKPPKPLVPIATKYNEPL
jgi:Na+-driven multidrug efflux pump